MTTEQTPQEPAPEAEASEEKAPDANAELRAALKREKEKTSQYRGELIGSRLEEIGLKADSGLGKAIAKEYDGELTVDALSNYAFDEYDYKGAVEQTPPSVEVGETMTQLESISETVTPAEPVDHAAELTSKMDDPDSTREDAAASLAAKAGQFYEEHYGNPA